MTDIPDQTARLEGSAERQTGQVTNRDVEKKIKQTTNPVREELETELSKPEDPKTIELILKPEESNAPLQISHRKIIQRSGPRRRKALGPSTRLEEGASVKVFNKKTGEQVGEGKIQIFRVEIQSEEDTSQIKAVRAVVQVDWGEGKFEVTDAHTIAKIGMVRAEPSGVINLIIA